jgi:hypothetical protein
MAIGHATDSFDPLGRLDDPNLEEQVREVANALLVEAWRADSVKLAA